MTLSAFLLIKRERLRLGVPIDVESDPGEGTCFTINIPLKFEPHPEEGSV